MKNYGQERPSGWATHPYYFTIVGFFFGVVFASGLGINQGGETMLEALSAIGTFLAAFAAVGVAIYSSNRADKRLEKQNRQRECQTAMDNKAREVELIIALHMRMVAISSVLWMRLDEIVRAQADVDRLKSSKSTEQRDFAKKRRDAVAGKQNDSRLNDLSPSLTELRMFVVLDPQKIGIAIYMFAQAVENATFLIERTKQKCVTAGSFKQEDVEKLAGVILMVAVAAEIVRVNGRHVLTDTKQWPYLRKIAVLAGKKYAGKEDDPLSTEQVQNLFDASLARPGEV